MTAIDPSPVTVFWRPGCPFCSGLRRRLRQLGVRTTEINIWAAPEAAAIVRRYAGGNETVPTVIIGDTAMVNPSGADVLEAARRLAPEALSDAGPLPAPPRQRPAPAVIVAWLVVAAAVAGSFAADLTGHGALSWALDGVAIAAYVAVRLLRRRRSSGALAT